MMLSIPTGRDLRGPTEKRANVFNLGKRLAAFRFMRSSGMDILGG
jgi:hypothetical protein